MTHSLTEKSAPFDHLDGEEPKELEKPQSLEVEKSHQTLKLKLKGRPGILALILGFSLVIDAAACAIIYSFAQPAITQVLTLAILIFGLLNLFLPALFLGPLFNHFRITIKSLKLGYWQTPFSFAGGKIVNTFDILNFSLEKLQPKLENKQSAFYILMHLKNGKVEKICRTRNLAEALYIEKVLEEELGLLNQKSEALD